MEFYFPLKPVTPGVLEHLVAAHGGRMTRSAIPVPETVGRLHFAPIRGYMKGFIDLVFEHQGRFYLIDWKSNRLGSRLEDYHRNRLDAVMVEHWYHVQYYLYTLAFHQYLRNRVPGYDYARDFGGICYVFLRGVTRDEGPEFGLFHDRPAPALVQALGETLIERYA
jgi:exodeoxyribonuclease V beta subunit